MNPFCEIGVEEALRWREGGHATEVTAVTIGPKQDEAVLRSAYGLGVDRAIHVLHDAPAEPLTVAKLVAAVARREEPGVLLLGKQAIDGDHNQTGQMCAALLQWPQATFASQVLFKDDGRIEVTREVDAGSETVSVRLPAVVTTDLRLNEPRYAAFKNLLAAKKKKIETLTAEELGVSVTSRLRQVSVEKPPARSPGVILGSVSELVAKLKASNLL
eukprot:TRINITY_DN7314_c0_g1_i1.p1 TRINITY_DN7314_c0_g1~~TRINITY_DN7314_c0_g1_i1.p1  ORF type:complete len:216 (+),score=32.10 TRINITY_DN7314_c0_g1_i1:149-796(+)